MQFTTVLALLAATAAAAPTPADSVSMVAAVPQWTITSFRRTCNSADTSCTISFGVDTHLAPITPCTYTITASSLASRAPANGVTCGPYSVTSGWSGQFGEGNGFTVWSVVDWSKRLITWPSYSDRQLVNGVVVVPDQSYAPQTLA